MGKQNLLEDELRMMAGKDPASGGGVMFSPSKLKTKAGSAGSSKSKGGNTSESLQLVNPESVNPNTNTNNPKGINPKGIVQPAASEQAAAAPSVQATATGNVQTQTPTAAQTAAASYSRPATAAYQESQQVQDALANLNAILQGQPNAYQQSQAVTNAYNALLAAQQGQPGNYQQSQQVQDAYAALQAAMAEKPGSYQQSQQVQDAYNQLMNLQNNQPGAYAPSQAVLDAQAALQNLQTTKPQGYNSKYQPQMDQLLQQIMNPGTFNYEFNGDNLFKMYADEYTQRGKQASLDAMGQAAALTGGYGNSYAQQVANQAYDQNLTELYDRGLELRDRAYQQYLDEQSRLYDKYGLLNTADQNEYNRYRDTVGDWQNERGYYTDLYNNERNYDYNQYRDQVGDWKDNRSFAAQMYDAEANRDYNQYRDLVGDWESNRDYLANQYNNERNIDYNQYRDMVNDWMTNRDYATNAYNNERNYDYNQYRDLMNDWMTNRDYATNQYNQLSNVDYSRYADQRDMAEQQYQYDTNMQENIRQFNESLEWEKMNADQKYAAEYAMQILANGQMPSEAMLQAAGLSAEDAQKMMAQIAASGGTGGNNNKTVYVDKNGLFYTYDAKGNARSVDAEEVASGKYNIDKSEDTGTKGAQAAINDKYRKENDKLKKAMKNRD